MSTHVGLQVAIEAAQAAGASILRDASLGVEVFTKSDGTKVTRADLNANDMLVLALAKTGIEVVSEEGGNLALHLDRYWLVDPLDGTKEFLANTGDFTVNVALVEDDRPVLGVVFAPARDDLFWGGVGLGAHRIRSNVTQVLQPSERSASCRMARSRFSHTTEAERFRERNGITETVEVGAALKYGLMAAGELEVFPRFTGSMEWDIAAGQAILEAVGGSVIDLTTCAPLRCGKPERSNPHFVAMRAPYTLDDFDL